MKTGETKYWVASRCVYCLEGVYYFGVKWIDTNGYLNESGIWNVNPDETTKAGGGNRGLRPIFVLANNVKITGGQGTEEDPFELGL